MPLKLPFVKLRNLRTGETRKLNYHDYVQNLGKYMRGWKLISQSDVGVTREGVDLHLAEQAGERARYAKPGHISRGDERRRFEGRAITIGGASATILRAQVAEEMARMA